MIYLLTAIGLSPGGSTHLHTNNIINAKFGKCRKSGDLAPRILNLGSAWRLNGRLHIVATLRPGNVFPIENR